MSKDDSKPEEGKAWADKLLAETRQRIDTNMRLLTQAGAIKQISYALQEFSSLSKTMHELGDGKIDLAFEQPLNIPTDIPKPKKQKDQPKPPLDPRLAGPAVQLGNRLIEADLKVKGIPLEGAIDQEAAREIGLPIVELTVEAGKGLFENMADLGDVQFGGHPLSEISAIDLSPIGFQVLATRTLNDGSTNEGVTISLADIDQRRLMSLKVLSLDLRENPNLRTSMTDILGGIQTSEIF